MGVSLSLDSLFHFTQTAQTHGTSPSKLQTLAQAYRASGRLEKGRAAAKQGLALLPTLQPGSVKPNIRKLLEKASSADLRF